MKPQNIEGVKFPTSKTSQATFDALVKSAEKLIGSNGYFQTSVSDITKNVNTATGTFYRYFESKYAMYEYLLAKYQTELRSALNAEMGKCATRYEKERAGLRTFIERSLKNPLCYHLVWESLFVNPELFRKYYQSFSNSYVRSLSSENVELAVQDYETLSYILMGINNFVGLQALFFNESKGASQDFMSEGKNDAETAKYVDKVINTAMYVLKFGMFH